MFSGSVQAKLLLAVQAAAPELGISALREGGRGWTCAVFVSPEGFGVRVPLSAPCAEKAAASAALLPRIAAHLPFAVPEPIAQARWAHGSMSIFRWIPGRPRPRLGVEGAAALGDALRQLHALPANSLTAGLDRPRWEVKVERYVGALRRVVQPRLSAGAAARWGVVIEACRAAALDPSAGRAILHGDLELEEVLWSGRRLMGLSDWDDWSVGDPAWEMRFLAGACDDAELQALTDAYGPAPGLSERRSIYAAIVPLGDALSALRRENVEHRRDALESLEAPLPASQAMQ